MESTLDSICRRPDIPNPTDDWRLRDGRWFEEEHFRVMGLIRTAARHTARRGSE